MRHSYIALIGKQDPQASAAQDSRLRAIGMECRFNTDRLRIFTLPGMPALSIPGRGIVLGHIFSKDGQKIVSAEALGQGDIAGNLLNNHWGEYLLLLQGERTQEITALRDPSGAVPCAYSLDDDQGFLTSDISLAVELDLYRRQVDWQAIIRELRFPYLHTAGTALQDIRELLPGCLLRCRGTTVSTATAWSPWQFVSDGLRHRDPRSAAADVRDSIISTVKALAALDERLLVQVSGGLDSSIVAACLGDAATRASFCSLVVPVAGTDERPYAKLVTDALGRELITVHVGMDDVSIDFPVPPSAVVPVLGAVQHANNKAWEAASARHGADALFSGNGGDSIFCYLKTAAPAADALRERGLLAGLRAIRNLSALHACTLWKAGRLTIKKLCRRPPRTWKEDRALLNPALFPVAHAPEAHPWMAAPPGALPGDRERIAELIGTQRYRHARPYGETHPMRFPLLAQPVMEACLKVPTWMWIAEGRNRAIARDAFAATLPAGILHRRSKGSYTVHLAGIYMRNRRRIRQFLEGGELVSHDIIDRAALATFLGTELAPRDLSFLRIFDLCTVENWLRGQRQAASSVE